MSFTDVSKSRKKNFRKKSSHKKKRGSKRNNNSKRINNPKRKSSNKRRQPRSKFKHKRASQKRDGSIDKSIYISSPKPVVETSKSEFIGESYSQYNFQSRLAENLIKKGFQTTTEIQSKTIPLILKGNNVLGISETGSGKTGAFLVPLINKLITDRSKKLLVVAPTRELALQIAKEVMSFARGTGLFISTIIGGENQRKQLRQLKQGDQIVVGTPGRLKDLIRQGYIKIPKYNNIVVDEVDRLLDMGFIADIKFIFEGITKKKQALFFSATHNKKVEEVVSSLVNKYDIVKLANNKPKDSIVQSVIDFTHSNEKLDILHRILNKPEVKKTIVFVDTKRYADKVDKVLHKQGHKVGVIHGNKTQNFRKRMIDKFKNSKIDVLVATNVAARGIDIDDITHVINLDEPQTYDEYIHRIGRTGRNGTHGIAYTFVARN